MMLSMLSHLRMDSVKQHQQPLHFSAFSSSCASRFAHLQSHMAELHVNVDCAPSVITARSLHLPNGQMP